MNTSSFNVARYLEEMAKKSPQQVALKSPKKRWSRRRVRFNELNFKQLNHLSDKYAWGLNSQGVVKGTRVLLMVKPGNDLIALVFSLFKIGAIPILIDPGMGVKNLLNCIKHSRPEALVAIPFVHALSLSFSSTFSSIHIRVTVGRRYGWSGISTKSFVKEKHQVYPTVESSSKDSAAILFTSGSTGAPKGVLYQHGQFQAQVNMLRKYFGIKEGEVDLPMLPIFSLFNPALGMTTVIPKMNPSRPASVDPRIIVNSILDQKVTNSFGSPVLWRKITNYCIEKSINLTSLKRVFMAGAPVPPELLRDFKKQFPQTTVITPYGATESLPLSFINDEEILQETAILTESGHGMCVGKALEENTIRIIEPQEGIIKELPKALNAYERGEIIVKGPVVTTLYDGLIEETQKAKIYEGDSIWHRIGDLGYIDDKDRLWFCGRKAHAVYSDGEIFYSVCCEAIFNHHPLVKRSALISINHGKDTVPALVVELFEYPAEDPKKLAIELFNLGQAQQHTKTIKIFYTHKKFPVDVRHNAKIHRIDLAHWAIGQKPLPLPII